MPWRLERGVSGSPLAHQCLLLAFCAPAGLPDAVPNVCVRGVGLTLAAVTWSVSDDDVPRVYKFDIGVRAVASASRLAPVQDFDVSRSVGPGVLVNGVA